MPRNIQMNPADFLTVGTIGSPGNRTFYLQGARRQDVISVILEKQQAAVLGQSIESLLRELKKGTTETESYSADLRLRQPVEPLYRVGNMGLGYSEDLKRIVITAYEQVPEDEDANGVSFWITIDQARMLVPHIQRVVKSGRPVCGNCGRAIDREGHFCPRRNGHQH